MDVEILHVRLSR